MTIKLAHLRPYGRPETDKILPWWEGAYHRGTMWLASLEEYWAKRK